MKKHSILNDPFLNKGTAFTQEERKELDLIGLLPPYIQTIEEQAAQTLSLIHICKRTREKFDFV